MADAKRDDWFALEILPHEPQLRTYLKNHFPTLEDIDDVIQESYARLLTIRQDALIKEPKALLFTISRNTVYDLFRRRKVVEFKSLTHFSDSSVFKSETQIEETVSVRDEIDLLKRAVETLPKRCRQVLTLKMVYEYSYKEIARELDISVNTVKVQLARGMRRCAQYFASHGDR